MEKLTNEQRLKILERKALQYDALLQKHEDLERRHRELFKIVQVYVIEKLVKK